MCWFVTLINNRSGVGSFAEKTSVMQSCSSKKFCVKFHSNFVCFIPEHHNSGGVGERGKMEFSFGVKQNSVLCRGEDWGEQKPNSILGVKRNTIKCMHFLRKNVMRKTAEYREATI